MEKPNASIDLVKRTTLALSFIAYEETKQCVESYLELLEPVIGSFRVVWGPAFHYNFTNKTDGMTYLVQNKNQPAEYYIAIRGTTPLTLTDWIFHDFLVGSLVGWNMVPFDNLLPPAQPASNTPAISFGTNNALVNIINHLNDDGINLGYFLQEQTKQTRQSIKISITGHSLGGLLAPILALYLAEHWPTNLEKPQFNIYGYAGPAAVNQVFATYFEQSLGSHFKNYGNHLDAATYAWNVDELAKLPSLYDPIQMPEVLLVLLRKIVIPAVNDKNYTRIGSIQPPIFSRLVDFGFPNQYIVQAAYQHFFPYLAEFIRLCPPEHQEQYISYLDSLENVKTFKDLKPLNNAPGKDLRYYLQLLYEL